jgi:ribonuclease HI
LHKLKSYLAKELLVIVPELEAPLLLYVAASDHAVSGALIQEEQKGAQVIQRSVYYISEALLGAKLNYLELEKIAYAVIISSRKLKHYFQAHEITIPTSLPLGDIRRDKEASGRIGKWATKLSQFSIAYAPRTTIKSQALADFMADWTPPASEPEVFQSKTVVTTWTVYTDGAWGNLGAGASAVIHAPSGLRSKYAARLEFQATNNITEYEGVILGLNKAKALGAKNLVVKTDSQVIAGLVEKEYAAKEPELSKYLEVVRGLERRFRGFTLKYIPRAENAKAGELAKAAANNLPLPADTFYQIQHSPATKGSKAFLEVLLTEFED